MRDRVILFVLIAVFLFVLVVVKLYPEEEESDDVWRTIISFVERGLEGVEMTDRSISDLESKINELTLINEDQFVLIEEAQDMISSLKEDISRARYSVEVALDRMNDAEGYALFMDSFNQQLLKENSRLQKNRTTGFLIGGASFGLGASIITYGLIRSDSVNWATVGIGASVIAVPSLVWYVGQFFHWW